MPARATAFGAPRRRTDWMSMSAASATEATRTTRDAPEISVVVPCLNERDSLPELVRRLQAAFPAAGAVLAEFVLVDDGSSDGSAVLLGELAAAEPRLVPVLRPRRGGQTAALWDGLRRARGTWIAHLDGDLQNDPGDLPAMLQVAQQGYDAVFGYRAARHDNWRRRAASRFANAVRRSVLHDHIRDIGCSTRVVHRAALAALPELPDLHRYLPALVERAGWRFVQVPARHEPRRHGVSKYTNLGRGLRGLVDLMRVARVARHLDGPASR
jgi:dolichol-phosphate mannosyltransferase